MSAQCVREESCCRISRPEIQLPSVSRTIQSHLEGGRLTRASAFLEGHRWATRMDGIIETQVKGDGHCRPVVQVRKLLDERRVWGMSVGSSIRT